LSDGDDDDAPGSPGECAVSSSRFPSSSSLEDA
jgi:hypothetical protein